MYDESREFSPTWGVQSASGVGSLVALLPIFQPTWILIGTVIRPRSPSVVIATTRNHISVLSMALLALLLSEPSLIVDGLDAGAWAHVAYIQPRLEARTAARFTDCKMEHVGRLSSLPRLPKVR